MSFCFEIKTFSLHCAAGTPESECVPVAARYLQSDTQGGGLRLALC